MIYFTLVLRTNFHGAQSPKASSAAPYVLRCFTVPWLKGKFSSSYLLNRGHFLALLVKALRYKPEGHGFDFRWCPGMFHWHNPSVRNMTLGKTQTSKRNEYQGYFLGMRRADSFTTFMCRFPWNLEALNSWKPQSLSRPVQRLLYVLITKYE